MQIQVAVKCLNQEHAQAGTTEFLKEATNMHSLEHENIVQFFGVVLGGNTIMLVRQWLNLVILFCHYCNLVIMSTTVFIVNIFKGTPCDEIFQFCQI